MAPSTGSSASTVGLLVMGAGVCGGMLLLTLAAQAWVERETTQHDYRAFCLDVENGLEQTAELGAKPVIPRDVEMMRESGCADLGEGKAER